MPLVPCEKCGVFGRDRDPACWSCGHTRVSTPGPEPVKSEAEKDAESRSGCVFGVAMWLIFVFLASVGDPNLQLTARAFYGAVPAIVASWFVFGIRNPWVSAAVFSAGGMAAASSYAGPADAEQLDTLLTVWPVLLGIPVGIAVHLLRTAGGPGTQPAAEQTEEERLRADEDRILRRLKEIAAQQKRVESARELLAREGSVPALAPVREKLSGAATALARQRARHTARLWAIEVVRWQARLAAGMSGHPDWISSARRLEWLGAAVAEGEAMLRAVRREGETYEGERCIAQIQAVLARCREARQALLVEEARLALRGIDASNDEQRTAALSSEPLESLQADLGAGGSVAHAVARFDAEHERVREEDEDAQAVEHFLRELERESP